MIEDCGSKNCMPCEEIDKCGNADCEYTITPVDAGATAKRTQIVIDAGGYPDVVGRPGQMVKVSRKQGKWKYGYGQRATFSLPEGGHIMFKAQAFGCRGDKKTKTEWGTWGLMKKVGCAVEDGCDKSTGQPPPGPLDVTFKAGDDTQNFCGTQNFC